MSAVMPLRGTFLLVLCSLWSSRSVRIDGAVGDALASVTVDLKARTEASDGTGFDLKIRRGAVDDWEGHLSVATLGQSSSLLADGESKDLEQQCISHNQIVDCFAPSDDACSVTAQRKAIVTAYDFHTPLDLNAKHFFGFEPKIEYFKSQAEAAIEHGADYIMLIPEGTSTSTDNMRVLADLGMTFHAVPWLVPPSLSKDVPVESGGCCGAREFMKLHSFNLTNYDAIIFYDSDIRIEGKREAWPEGALTPIFNCAASRHFLTTPSAGHDPWVNGGFFAVKPNGHILDVMLEVLTGASTDTSKGWNGAGWGPGRDGVETEQFRMQGFLTYFMYQDARQNVADGAGGQREMSVLDRLTSFGSGRSPVQLQQCIWNKQYHSICADCATSARVFHHSDCNTS